MAIQAIPESKAAYQGSVPGTESISISPERTQVTVQAEPLSNESRVNAGPEAGKDTDNRNDEGSASRIFGTETLKRVADEINRNAKNSEAVFGVHDGTNRITIKIIDRDTKEVLKEYPPEKTLDMIAKVWEMAGLMVDEKR